MTYAETIESLRCCFGFGTCSECKAKSMMEEDPIPCKLDCKDRLGLYAADLIERLTAENADLRKEIEWKDMVIALAQRKQAEAEAERDALREKQRWIPVTERLPEKQTWCHVAIRDKKTMRIFVEQDLYAVETARNFGHETGFCKANRWPEREELIAWMLFPPAPEAPEEGEKA